MCSSPASTLHRPRLASVSAVASVPGAGKYSLKSTTTARRRLSGRRAHGAANLCMHLRQHWPPPLMLATFSSGEQLAARANTCLRRHPPMRPHVFLLLLHSKRLLACLSDWIYLASRAAPIIIALASRRTTKTTTSRWCMWKRDASGRKQTREGRTDEHGSGIRAPWRPMVAARTNEPWPAYLAAAVGRFGAPDEIRRSSLRFDMHLAASAGGGGGAAPLLADAHAFRARPAPRYPCRWRRRRQLPSPARNKQRRLAFACAPSCATAAAEATD